ncbi:hypothetical protein DE146DRAFT_751110 [Phaeosphaeria sp. MPI-PUGE-AT-0046c]|nr:hypothetical protein DE146DRAFT_751110 [Phaeosphaeria sp. MPI-PUGE-AT-0046c]
MLQQLQRTLNRGKTWIPTFRKRQSVYSQWTSANRTELQNLAATTKSDIDVNTEYNPHPSGSSASSIVSVERTWVQRIFGNRFTGWRFGALHFGLWAALVFSINLIVTIWGTTARKSGVLLEGDCGRVDLYNNGLHVLINVLSTILLSGSNYCMQCLSAPTRDEVNKAHANKRWLDIGIPSIRNVKHLVLRHIKSVYITDCSSYNSAVFGSLSSNDYFAFSVSKSFLEDTECRNCSASHKDVSIVYRPLYENPWQSFYTTNELPRILEGLYQEYHAGLLDRLEPKDCISQYATSIQSNRRNVLLVASDENFPPPEENAYLNNSHVYWASPFYANDARNGQDSSNAYNWICSTLNLEGVCSNNVDGVRNNVQSWRVGNKCTGGVADAQMGHACDYKTAPVEYCLSQKAQPHCRLQFDSSIAIVVTILNFVKAVLMFYIAYCIPEEPLITMGDAVASFLQISDRYSQGLCLLSIHDVRKGGYRISTRQWTNERFRWKDVASRTRRAMTLSLFVITLTVVASLLVWGIVALPVGTPRGLADLVRLGYGKVDPVTAITGLSDDLILNAVIANSPQVMLSMLYFSYNALFTSFLLSHEWVSYAHKKKGLRVSSRPVGEQRTDYFLQLPYRFGIPLMVLSGTLHWLVSQAIFLVSIDFYDVFGQPGTQRYFTDARSAMKTCGYSPIAIITVVIFGSIMIIALIGFGRMPYKQGMPLAGSSSMAISAACHPGNIDGATSSAKKVQWGVVSVDEDGIGHCSFSTNVVTSPIKGNLYAGTQSRRG